MRFFILLSFLLFNSIIFSQTSSDDCYNVVHGNVFDIQAEKAMSNIVVHINKDDVYFTSISTDNNGSFTLDLPCDNSRYIVTSTIENFTKSTKLIFTSRSTKKEHNITLDIYPIREFVTTSNKKRIIVKPIYFIPDDYGITPEASKELSKVYDILIKYPDISIEIGFHSDSRGEERFLGALTQKRADACASYLINRGIESDRIIAKGFGSTKLLNECERGVKCSNTKHLMNKRSEFIVFKKELS